MLWLIWLVQGNIPSFCISMNRLISRLLVGLLMLVREMRMLSGLFIWVLWARISIVTVLIIGLSILESRRLKVGLLVLLFLGPALYLDLRIISAGFSLIIINTFIIIFRCQMIVWQRDNRFMWVILLWVFWMLLKYRALRDRRLSWEDLMCWLI